ncbi:MAG TPA: response regulator transcription factor [Pyrinomonadaceae bacterium]|nr:response regulator transcription factor [Pyrinomonadaceae bacterium]
MKILIAEDDLISRHLLAATLEKFGYEVIVAADGAEAWDVLQTPDAPQLAILDWMMPKLDGVELCRRVRARPAQTPPYLILLTARSGKADVVAGLDAGANDYLTKPFDSTELRARVQVGAHVLELQNILAARIGELEDALSQVKQLQGLLPICSYCKKIRDEKNYWQRVDNYLSENTDMRFTHGICPDCYETAMLEVKHSQREVRSPPAP